MNEIEECENLADSLLARLGLPFVLDTEAGEREADIVDTRLAVMFPNLSAQERSGIAAAHLARAVVRLNSATQRDTLSGEQRRQLTAITANARTSHRKALDALERYGLRAKLTDFQEKLLAHFCEGDSPV